MLDINFTQINERLRRLLRCLSELEEKYSVRSSRLLSGEQTLAVALMEKSDEVRRDVELWRELYTELAKLENLRNIYRGKHRG
ncbi:MAG: hypothetical protein RMI56_03235 [Sulfolobales archaeon]|nr:hypothetical protein [Sulfolobales archaeon]MDW8082794.1 hypothetical protein [Sulfolobales archaeon]